MFRHQKFLGKVTIAVAAAGFIVAATNFLLVLQTKRFPSLSYPDDVISRAPFEHSLPLFTDKVLQGYLNRDEFESDLRNFSQSYVNRIFRRNTGNWILEGMAHVFWNGVLQPEYISIVSTSHAESSPVCQGANDFRTNHGVDSVDEGDKVQTNGKIAVAVYGQYIVGWSVTNGTSLLKMKLELTSSEYSQPVIHTLFLKDNLLVVVAGSKKSLAARQTQTRVLSDCLGTRIFVFNISSIGKDMNKLDLLAQRDINGYIVSILAIGNHLHLILRTQLNLYPFLALPFERNRVQNLSVLNTSEYLKQVQKSASTTHIPRFAQQVADEIMECGVLPLLVRLNRWTTQNVQSLSTYTVERFLYRGGYAQSLVTIASFDLTNVTSNSLKCASVAGAFVPGSDRLDVYSGNDTMVMAVGGYDYSSSRNTTIQSTYVVAFDLDGTSVRPKSIGKFEGFLTNQFSFRVDGSVLQLATTLQKQWVLHRVSERHDVILIVPATENWIITANLDGKNGTIELLDKLKLGKEGERFTYVHLHKNRVYAVASTESLTGIRIPIPAFWFLKRDPLYVLDTSNPYKISKPGVLEQMTALSTILKPVNTESSVMLAIGQEKLGTSFSVFDARNLNKLNVAARTLPGSNTSFWPSSEGFYNKDAIRFSAETGILIFPVTMGRVNQQTGNYFCGFRVYIATLSGVRESCIIDLSHGNEAFNYRNETMISRAVIINGNVMTTMGSNVTMTNLDTCTRVWDLTIS